MLVSLNWLNKYVDISNMSPEELAERITKSGIEVDRIEYIGEANPDVVVGYVETCEKHPDADKLNVCQVDVGQDEALQIVCGAPNVAKGQKVIVAKPGATLPGDMKIKKVKLRGVESNGMICSLQELGIDEKYIPSEYADGIYVFPDDVTVGERIEPLLNMDDVVLEFDLTPNRADSLSMLGVAYEVAAILDQPLHLPEVSINEIDEEADQQVKVNVEATDLCPYYGAFIVKNVEIKPSPLWMQHYLIAAGIRPINNVVDITNYVLLEYGQPLHAFDYDRLNSKEILVRRANDAEKIVTLDDVERQLTNDDLVITNGEKPIALAGVMGGANTEVHDGTTNILLEAAFFDPGSVRKTVKKTGLRSEASTRFEKGVDPNRVREAGQRACQLLEKYANGKVFRGVVEYDRLDRSEKTVMIHTDEINKRLGSEMTSEEIADILRKLRFEYKQEEKQFTVQVPTRRGDISIFEDMLEEVARIYGYDNLPFTLPKHFSQVGTLTKRQQLMRKMKTYLQSAGLMEARTYSLTKEVYASRFISPEIQARNPYPISVQKPMTEDHQYLRLSLVPELLKSMAYNKARNEYNLAFYEMGNIFISDEEKITKQPNEEMRISGALTGEWVDHKWQGANQSVDFFVVKGILEGLFHYLQLPVEYKASELPQMHPGRCATIYMNNEPIGFLGQVHPLVQIEMDLKETYVFDLNGEAILDAHTHHATYDPIPKYPSIERDIAFILDQDVLAGDVKSLIEKLGSPLVKEVQIFDVYSGEHLPEGKKSVAYHLVYQDPNKTLKDDEVEESFKQIIDQVNKTFNAYVRS
ncbi:MAG TPA: phenylalanine--tRNA ligase subunit beta [Cerasibacillus sp.]|uniref:phenylalanine--tRNA ligase subunit beta n=1 Tax=Cerasibacillus sp. TaxID=2498711 RepID=UPI002F3F47F1